MRTVSITLDYLPIEKAIELIDEPHRAICRRILAEHRPLFEKTYGSTHNHQVWEGGYIDHITDCMSKARHQYTFDAAFGSPMKFSLSDALLILFLHDLEKPWRILVNAQGERSNKEGLDTKDAYKKFREDKLTEYGLVLSDYQMNALTYVEGEYKDYSSKRRVMNELGAFCHCIDTKSARVDYDYPRVDDEWTGAGRFRTT